MDPIKEGTHSKTVYVGGIVLCGAIGEEAVVAKRTEAEVEAELDQGDTQCDSTKNETVDCRGICGDWDNSKVVSRLTKLGEEAVLFKLLSPEVAGKEEGTAEAEAELLQKKVKQSKPKQSDCKQSGEEEDLPKSDREIARQRRSRELARLRRLREEAVLFRASASEVIGQEERTEVSEPLQKKVKQSDHKLLVEEVELAAHDREIARLRRLIACNDLAIAALHHRLSKH